MWINSSENLRLSVLQSYRTLLSSKGYTGSLCSISYNCMWISGDLKIKFLIEKNEGKKKCSQISQNWKKLKTSKFIINISDYTKGSSQAKEDPNRRTEVQEGINNPREGKCMDKYKRHFKARILAISKTANIHKSPPQPPPPRMCISFSLLIPHLSICPTGTHEHPHAKGDIYKGILCSFVSNGKSSMNTHQ